MAWLEAYGNGDASYDEFFAGVDRLVMGSKTYEQVLGFGEWPYEGKPADVLTRRDLPLAADTVTLVDGPVDDLVERLRSEGDHVWLVGGGRLARSFLRSNGVDELRVSLVPVLLGRGIPLSGRRRAAGPDAPRRDHARGKYRGATLPGGGRSPVREHLGLTGVASALRRGSGGAGSTAGQFPLDSSSSSPRRSQPIRSPTSSTNDPIPSETWCSSTGFPSASFWTTRPFSES